MTDKLRQRIYRVTILVTSVAILFILFFQVNKAEPFREVSPFVNDPYDAIGSFAIQIAALLGVLNYARGLRLRIEPEQLVKTHLVLRGNALVILAILITLLGDTIAEIISKAPPSVWSDLLLVELFLMFLLTVISTIALVIISRQVPYLEPPSILTLADALDDLWTLVRVPVEKAHTVLPLAFVRWVQDFNLDKLFARVPWLSPRHHPWRFASALGLLAGIALLGFQLREGLPPNARIGLLVAGIFLFAELSGTLLGFLLLGSYLGLRPPLTAHHAD